MSRPSPSSGTGGGQAAAALRVVLRAATGPHPVGEPVPVEVELRDPLVGPLLRSHFRRLRPGESFDPTAGGGDGYAP
ncbi:hypothetical protein ACFCYF_07365 [Streptomyces chartreusis]|uniref:hypothetical protein n=1 Tax=Streptomyces chartreusis TaxID=1969 RepID=UPI002E803A58|nr:hypothetical protein [Streptomyces chartreusis]WUB17827.1 hypothetical protein OG997_14340 [Streptomyces chartreusis]